MKTVCATLKSQCSIVIFAKIAKNWPNFSFLAIILVPDQKNPNFLDFLDPYTCLDMGHKKINEVSGQICCTIRSYCLIPILGDRGHYFRDAKILKNVTLILILEF